MSENDNMSQENDSTPLNDILKMIGEEYGIEGQPEIEVEDEEPPSRNINMKVVIEQAKKAVNGEDTRYTASGYADFVLKLSAELEALRAELAHLREAMREIVTSINAGKIERALTIADMLSDDKTVSDKAIEWGEWQVRNARM